METPTPKTRKVTSHEVMPPGSMKAPFKKYGTQKMVARSVEALTLRGAPLAVTTLMPSIWIGSGGPLRDEDRGATHH